MLLHEYQAKEILRDYGVFSSPFLIAATKEDVEKIITDLSLDDIVLKVQVHAGGRGKAGGVKRIKGQKEILDAAENMLGMKIVNNQTGPDGMVAHKLMLSIPSEIRKEYYISVICDRKERAISVIASKEGGVDIEETAKNHPDKICVEMVPESGKLRHFQLFRLVKFLGIPDTLAEKANAFIRGILRAFIDCDALMIEINPLVETEDGQLVALDAKMSIDDDAFFRQRRLMQLWDPSQLSQKEVQAKLAGLSYVSLSGSIGCMVNGAGLAMATMDLIRFYGGSPRNFLDVGGGASEEKIIEGFHILLSDDTIKGILINIFGGIMNCEIIARAMIKALEGVHNSPPIVIRMEGTNVAVAKKLLKESNVSVITADTFDDACQKIVRATG